MGFMEKEVLGSKSPLFGRRTAQLHMKPFNYQKSESFEENIKRAYLKVTSYLYEEALLLLRQEVQEPGVYRAIIEAIAGGYTKANEISTQIGEVCAKCLKHIKTLCEVGFLHRETPSAKKKPLLAVAISTKASGMLPAASMALSSRLPNREVRSLSAIKSVVPCRIST